MKFKQFALSLVVGALTGVGAAGIAYAQAPQAASSPYTTAQTPVGTLLDDPRSRAVLEAHVPAELFANPQIEMARGMTLRQLQFFAPNVLSDAVLDAIDVDLAALPNS